MRRWGGLHPAIESVIDVVVVGAHSHLEADGGHWGWAAKDAIWHRATEKLHLERADGQKAGRTRVDHNSSRWEKRTGDSIISPAQPLEQVQPASVKAV